MSNLALAARFARRELRGGLQGFRVFLICLTLGVAAIAGVGSVSESVTGGIERDARSLLGGDISLRLLHRPITAEQRGYISDRGDLSEVIEMRAMARSAGDRAAKRSLVELKAVDGAYPLVGTLETDSGEELGAVLARRDGLWGAAVEQALLAKLGLEIGDELRIGEGTFRINSAIKREPDRVATVLSFGARVMIPKAGLEETGLIRPGSLIRYRYRIAIGENADVKAWVDDVNQAFPEAGWRVNDRSRAAPGLQRFIDRLTLFLGFVGLTTLLVGGIGVSNAVGSYLDGKTSVIATFKCLGAPASLVFKVYLIQILVLALLGILLGVIIGGVAPMLAGSALNDLLPVELTVALFPKSLILAAIFGVLVSLTFALWPLARTQDIPPTHLFRARVAAEKAWPHKGYVIATAGTAVLLAGLIIATAERASFAMWFVGGAAVALLLLKGASILVIKGASKFNNIRHTELRLALSNLHRPGATTGSVVLSLGLGLTVLVAIALIEGNISRQVNERLPDLAPAFFFLDIQPTQVAAFDRTVNGVEGTGDFMRTATLRGRIVRIDGEPVSRRRIGEGSRWAVRGDRALTYSAVPLEGAKIVAGEWWPADYSGPPKISLDQDIARDFGVGLGDTLTLNILGREITAEITSLREIDWRSLRFDFAIIFAPGTLENAPHTHIAAIQAPKSLEDRIEASVSDRFANISVVRVREALQAAANIVAGVGTAVRAIASITIVAGAIVLAGAVAAGRRRRIYDAVVFKVLGATRASVTRAFLIEYGLLGLATGLIAAVIGSITAWAVIVFLMRADWVFIPETIAITLALCIAVTLFIGFAGTWRALGQKAGPLLRNE